MQFYSRFLTSYWKVTKCLHCTLTNIQEQPSNWRSLGDWIQYAQSILDRLILSSSKALFYSASSLSCVWNFSMCFASTAITIRNSRNPFDCKATKMSSSNISQPVHIKRISYSSYFRNTPCASAILFNKSTISMDLLNGQKSYFDFN